MRTIRSDDSIICDIFSEFESIEMINTIAAFDRAAISVLVRTTLNQDNNRLFDTYIFYEQIKHITVAQMMTRLRPCGMTPFRIFEYCQKIWAQPLNHDRDCSSTYSCRMTFSLFQITYNYIGFTCGRFGDFTYKKTYSILKLSII